MQLTLIQKKQETSDVISFVFKSQEPFAFKAGQFLRYKLDHHNPDSRGITRYFTIASAPSEDVTMLTARFAKENGSSFKEALKNLQIGGTIEAEGPRGKFVVGDLTKQYVFIAGGIGVTPFRSILLDLVSKKLPLSAILFYANRTSEIVYKNTFDSLASKNLGFKVGYVVDPGKITVESIASRVPNILEPYYYVSGPEPMVKVFEEWLPAAGVSQEHIIRDYFPGYESI